MKTTHKYLALLVAAVFALNGCKESAQNDNKKPVEETQKVQTKDEINMLVPDFAKLVEQEGATVVNIQAYKNTSAGSKPDNGGMDLNQLPDNDPFYDFFKRLVPSTPEVPQQEDEEDQNFGSGF